MISIVQEPIVICADIGCTNELGYFDKKNGGRFCRRCKITGKELRWKCASCDSIISSLKFRVTKKRCDICSGLVKK